MDGYNYGPPALQRSSSQFTMTQIPTSKAEHGQDADLTNEAAAALFQSPINTPGDALHLLLQASGQSGDIERHVITNQSAPLEPIPVHTYPSTTSKLRSDRPNASQDPGQHTYGANIDPAIAVDGTERNGSYTIKEDLSIWSRLRFVRSGWFTAKEAKAYVD